MNKQDYLTEAYRQLNNGKYYKEIHGSLQDRDAIPGPHFSFPGIREWPLPFPGIISTYVYIYSKHSV